MLSMPRRDVFPNIDSSFKGGHRAPESIGGPGRDISSRVGKCPVAHLLPVTDSERESR